MRASRRFAGLLLVAALCLGMAPGGAVSSQNPRPAQKQPEGPVTLALKCVHVRAAYAQKLLEDLLPAAPKGAAPLRMTADRRTNTLLMHGPADRLAQAREMVARIDVAAPGQQPLLIGLPLLKTYPVPGGNGEAIAAVLHKLCREDPDIRITAVGNSLLVRADPEDQLAIARHLAEIVPPPQRTEVIPLHASDATNTAKLLRAAYPRSKQGDPSIEVDVDRNALIVRGTAAQLGEIRAALWPNDPPEQGWQPGGMKVFRIEAGPVVLAETVGQVLSQMRANPVRVALPNAELPPKKVQEPAPPKQDGVKLPGKADAPVTLTAFGKRLIVTSDDPEALALVEVLVRVLTSPAGSEFEIIRMEFAKAADVARFLDEAFNGPQQMRGGMGLGEMFEQLFGGGAATPKQERMAPRQQRIAVAADPATNSLLIKASALDLLTVRKLLRP